MDYIVFKSSTPGFVRTVDNNPMTQCSCLNHDPRVAC